MNKRNHSFPLALLLGLALSGPLCTAGTAGTSLPAATSGCGITIAITDLVTDGQLDPGNLPAGSTVVYLLDQQGNILTAIDVSGADLFDITPYETAGSIFIPCEDSAQADRRIIVYQS